MWSEIVFWQLEDMRSFHCGCRAKGVETQDVDILRCASCAVLVESVGGEGTVVRPQCDGCHKYNRNSARHLGSASARPKAKYDAADPNTLHARLKFSNMTREECAERCRMYAKETTRLRRRLKTVELARAKLLSESERKNTAGATTSALGVYM